MADCVRQYVQAEAEAAAAKAAAKAAEEAAARLAKQLAELELEQQSALATSGGAANSDEEVFAFPGYESQEHVDNATALANKPKPGMRAL